MTSPTYGIVFVTSDNDPRPAVFSDLSVLGLVLPSDDADATKFPLNTPVDINTGDPSTLALMGTGPLFNTCVLINEQLADLQVSARAVVVRVASGGSIDATIANIVGDPGTQTGIYALLKSSQMLGVIPRLIGAPGYTGKFTRTGGSTGVTRVSHSGMVGNGVMTLGAPAYLTGAQAGTYVVKCIGGAKSSSSAAKGGGNTGNGTLGSLTADTNAMSGVWRVVFEIAATNAGTFIVYKPDGTFDGVGTVAVAYNSAAGPNFTIADGATDFVVGDEFDITIADVVPANGGVFSVKDPFGVSLANATVGVAYATQIAFTIADGATDFSINDEFDVTVVISGGTALANPICAALPAVLNPLLAHAVVGTYNSAGLPTKQDETDWRGTLSSRRLIPVGNWVITGDGVTNINQDHAAVVLGLGVRVDFQNAGIPAHSFANQAVQGILGLGRYDSFSITDGATDGQELLAIGVGIIERGELASETAAGSSGFLSIALRNCDADPIWQFYNKSRTRDYTHLALLRSIRLRLGRDNVTPHGIQAVLNDMVVILTALKQAGATVGATVGFDPSANSPDNLRLGQFRVFFKSEEPAPITQITIDSLPNRNALIVELSSIITQAGTLSVPS